MVEGQLWFAATDVCLCLNIVNVSHACNILAQDEIKHVKISGGVGDPATRAKRAKYSTGSHLPGEKQPPRGGRFRSPPAAHDRSASLPVALTDV